MTLEAATSAKMVVSTMVVQISENKFVLAAVSALLIVGMASAASDFYYNDGGSDGFLASDEPGLDIPEYDSNEEILTQFVAPFLLIAILLQIALQRALMFTLADSDGLETILTGSDQEKRRIRRQSMILSLVITGMIVPTTLFQYINELMAVLFGGITYVFFIAVVIAFLMVLWSGFKGGRGE